MAHETLLLDPTTRLSCPHCTQEFSLEQGFARQALESIQASSQASLTHVRDEERRMAENRAQQALAAGEAALAERERTMAGKAQEAAAVRAAELVAREKQSYERQLMDAREQVRTLRDEQLQLREERQRVKDERDALALEVRKQVDARIAQRESQVRAQEQERAGLEKADLLKTIDGMKQKLDEASRRAEQSSQQLQGEVLEIAIEDALLRSFPLDVFEPVRQGARGADVIHRVTADGGRIAGTILWEMKRAKDFSPAWVAKLKEETRTAGADVAVLVTMPSATPKDWGSGQAFALVDGVWVCINALALQLAAVLRMALLDINKQRLISAGKGEKMEAVYDYVTSVQFGQKLRAVYDTFRLMRDELESERNATQQRWARREKQLQAGISSLLGMGGEIQGLAQQSLPALELEERRD